MFIFAVGLAVGWLHKAVSEVSSIASFLPYVAEATVGAVIPGEPPPQYSSDPETETERETLQTAAETGVESGPETTRPASAPPPAGQL